MQEIQQPYNKIKLLGKGSMGKVYLVQSIENEKYYVAKKIRIQHLNQQQKQNVYKEAYILQSLNHPNIISFKDIYLTKKHKLCIVMEYAQMGDLDKKIQNQNEKHFEQKQILKWFTEICLGLKKIHEKNIIHRDLKGANIFLTKDNVCKIGDFGISKVLNQTAECLKSFVGTPNYLSPQMVEGKNYSKKTDIWSLGVILYHLCALKMPFQANSLPLLALRIIKGQIAPLPKNIYSKELKSLILSLLHVDQKKRPSIEQILRNPLLKQFIPTQEVNKVEKKQQIKQQNVIKNEQREKRQNLRKDMRQDIKKKKLQAQAKKTINPSNAPKLQKITPEVKKKSPQKPAIKPWKMNKKHKSEDIEVQMYLPPIKKVQKQQKIIENSDLILQIKVSEKVKRKIEQQQNKLNHIQLAKKNPIQFEQAETQQPFQQIAQEIQNQQEQIKAENIKFKKYDDKDDDGQIQNVHRQLNEQQEQTLKYITKSNNLEQLRLILEQRFNEKNFLLAYNILKEYMQNKIQNEEFEDIFEQNTMKQLKQMMSFIDGELFDKNLIFLYTLIVLENQQMKNNLNQN